VGSEAERQAIRAERSVRHDSSVRVRKENASTHVIPHNPMFRILGRTASQAACLGRSNAANFGTCGMRINSTNKYIKIVLIISDIPTTVQIGIGRFEALQLDADGNELSSQKGLLLLREGLVYSRSNLRAGFGNGKLLPSVIMCDMLECNEGDSVERRATRETEHGSVNYFCQTIYPNKCFFFSCGACGDHPPACRVYTQTR
jgi:hypothetical protein